jgi:hypothetical protein
MSDQATVNLALHHGADFSLPLEFKQANQLPIDLTDYSFEVEILRRDVVVGAMTVWVPAPTSGKIMLLMSRAAILSLPAATYRWRLFWEVAQQRTLKAAGTVEIYA